MKHFLKSVRRSETPQEFMAHAALFLCDDTNPKHSFVVAADLSRMAVSLSA